MSTLKMVFFDRNIQNRNHLKLQTFIIIMILARQEFTFITASKVIRKEIVIVEFTSNWVNCYHYEGQSMKTFYLFSVVYVSVDNNG